MTDTDAEPAHVDAVLVALTILGPAFFVFILVGPRETAVQLGLGLYLAILVGGVAITGLLDLL